MWLVLCTSDDSSALWAATRLRARGLSPLLVLTPELLHFSKGWQHRLGNDHPVSVEFTLASGQRVRGEDVKGVLNRIAYLSPHLVGHLASADRSYALQEWTALHVSWLSSLIAPVLNPPGMHGLCGAWRHESEWTWLAARAGLRTDTFVQRGTTSASGSRLGAEYGSAIAQSVFVVNDRVIGDGLPDDTAAACRELGRLAGTRVLGISLDPVRRSFLTATPRPDLTAGGDTLVGALYDALTGHA